MCLFLFFSVTRAEEISAIPSLDIVQEVIRICAELTHRRVKLFLPTVGCGTDIGLMILQLDAEQIQFVPALMTDHEGEVFRLMMAGESNGNSETSLAAQLASTCF